MRVYLDRNDNGSFDADEPITFLRSDDPNTPDVDETHTYRFTGLPAGDYVVRELLAEGYEQVAPAAPGAYAITLDAMQVADDLDFTNRWDGTIGGTKFLDYNRNGIRDRNPLPVDTPTVLMVMDVSGSTYDYSGFSVPDQNNHSGGNDIIGAEIYAMRQLREELIQLGWGDTAQVSVVPFASDATVLDLDPTDYLIGSYDTDGYAMDVQVVGSLAYVADGTEGVKVFDVSTPSTPALVGSYDSSNARDVQVVGSKAYVADWVGDLKIVDFADPSAPELLGSIALPGSARSVNLVGDLAYVATWGGGLQIVNVSEPAAPYVVGSCDTADFVTSVDVVGTRTYMTSVEGLHVLDVTDPSSPSLLGETGSPDGAGFWDVHVVGSLAHVARSGPTGLAVYDIADPEAIEMLSSGYSDNHSCYGVEVVESLVFMAGSTGVYVVNVENPVDAIHLRTYDTPGSAMQTCIDGTTAFVAQGTSGLAVLDIANASESSFFTTPNADRDGDGVSDLEQALTALRPVPAGTTGHGTDFEGALRTSIELLKTPPVTGEPMMFFTSDGLSDHSWAFDDEVATLDAMGVPRTV